MIPQFDHQFSNRTFYNFDENLNQPRHRWFPFKEGFSNQLVKEAVSNIPKKRALSIIDPFSGSGTTPLTAVLSGHYALGVEVNPFSAFASRVKCSKARWKPARYRSAVSRLIDEVQTSDIPSHLETFSSFSDEVGNKKWLFNRSVIRAACHAISAAKLDRNAYSDALVLAAIRAAMMCCNAKKDGKCLRYHRDWQERNYSKADFIRAFSNTTEMMLADIYLAPIPAQSDCKIFGNDSREVLKHLSPNTFDLLVTSPPYLNSFDYSDVYRPEMFLGGFVKDNVDLRKIRLKTVRSHVQVAWKNEEKYEHPLVNAYTKQLKTIDELWSSRLPNMVEAYFADMSKVLRNCFSLIRRGGQAWIVVSTSSYYGIHIPVDVLMAELGCEAGFKLGGIYVLRNLRGAAQQRGPIAGKDRKGLPLRESLIVLKK